MSIQQDKLKAIADKIREKTGSEGLIVPNNFVNEIDNVYEAARIECAKQSCDYGNKKSYAYWKNGQDITNLIIPYAITPTKVEYMFSNTITNDGNTIDLSVYDIDFSNCTSFNYWLNKSPIFKVGTINTTSCSSLATIFYGAENLVTIEHLILKDDGSQTLGADITRNCKKLVNINQITGYFGKNFTLAQTYNLSHDSLVNILNALYDYSGTTTAPTASMGATNLSRLSDDEKLIATNKGWSLA